MLLLDTPACSQLSLFHDSALPVNWIHQVRRESEEAYAVESTAGFSLGVVGAGGGAVLGGGR
jgi:hypothetical protein